MTKQNIYEFTIRLMGFFALLHFCDSVPKVMGTILHPGTLLSPQGFSTIVASLLLVLLALSFVIYGKEIAERLIRDSNMKSGERRSAIDSQDLLVVAVKITGLYCWVKAITELTFFYLVAGGILIFGSRHIVKFFCGGHFTAAVSRLGRMPEPVDPLASSQDSQDLLMIAVKVLGLYCLFNALLDSKISFFIIGVILVFMAGYIATLFGDENVVKINSRLGIPPRPKSGWLNTGLETLHRRATANIYSPEQKHENLPENEAVEIKPVRTGGESSPESVKKDADADQRPGPAIVSEQDKTQTAPPEQKQQDFSERKSGDQRKKAGFFAEIFGKPR